MNFESLLEVMKAEWPGAGSFWDWAWENYEQTMSVMVISEARKKGKHPPDPKKWTESRLYAYPN